MTTKMPVPMMAPTPIAVSPKAPIDFLQALALALGLRDQVGHIAYGEQVFGSHI